MQCDPHPVIVDGPSILSGFRPITLHVAVPRITNQTPHANRVNIEIAQAEWLLESTLKSHTDAPLRRLEVGRGVDGARRRLVVVLQGRLKGVALTGSRRAADFRLVDAGVAFVAVGHERFVLFVVALAAPDPPCHKPQGTKQDSAANANNDADNSVAGLSRHACWLGALSLTVEARRRGGHGVGGQCRLGPIRVGSGDDGNLSRDNGCKGYGGVGLRGGGSKAEAVRGR